MSRPLVDVQIVNYKTLRFLPKCVSSVLRDAQNSNIEVTIHIADNASGDDLSSLSREFPQTRISNLEENVGFGSGNNLLARKGEAPFILILNPDIVIQEEGTLKRLLTWIQESQCRVVGPRLVTLQGTTQWWDHGDFGHGLQSFITRKLGTCTWQEHTEPTEVAWVSGACLLITREVFEVVCGFDPNFFLYSEELDLCLRLRQHGYKVMYDPTVSVLHYGSVVASKDKYMAASERYFVRKHCRGLWKLLALATLWLKHR